MLNMETIRGRMILQVAVQIAIFIAVILLTLRGVQNSLEDVRASFLDTLISKSALLGRSVEDDFRSYVQFKDVFFEEAVGRLKGMIAEEQGADSDDKSANNQTELSYAAVLDNDGALVFADHAARRNVVLDEKSNKSVYIPGDPDTLAAQVSGSVMDLMNLPLSDAEKSLAPGAYYLRPEAEADPITGEPTLRVTMRLFEKNRDNGQYIENSESGYLVMGIPKAVFDHKMEGAAGLSATVRNYLILLLLSLIALNGIGYVMLNRLFLKPILLLKESSELIAGGHLSAEVAEDIRRRSDEVGALGGSFHQMSASIRRIVESIQNSVALVMKATMDISSATTDVGKASSAQSSSVNKTFQSMEEIGLAIGRTAENVDVLADSSEASSSSILELNAIIEEIAENVEQLASAVEDTTSSISQMNSSIHQVKENVEHLSVAADETASSITEMDATIKQVEGNAEDSAELAESFAADATRGLEAVNHTIEAIQKVQVSSHGAAQVMESLGVRIEEIGKILNVIDDVAEQTNLLALNAAIIAAQAGEHGKSFAVVADEIKDLAERTAASTAEIASIIKSVQAESGRAIESVFGSTRLVEEGVRRSQEAGDVLRRISGSSQEATEMVRNIARATVEQARGSAQITGAIDKIVNMVLQINVATTEQARGSTQIMDAAQKMREITIHVRSATREQSKGARQINEAMDRVIQMVEYINGAIKEQRGGSSEVLAEMETIRKSMEANLKATKAMDSAVENLQAQAEALRTEVQRFQL